MNTEYQVIIIGGGPAGLTAGIYAARAKMKALLVEKLSSGGQMMLADVIENYPGFPEGIPAFDLAEKMKQQAEKHGLKILYAEANSIELVKDYKVVKTSEGDYKARAVIITSGSEYSKLGVPGEEKFVGKGVAYCATCDGALFSDQVVAVAGGGNVALNDALFLTKFASKVFVIHRRDQLRATRILQERAFAESKIEFLWNTVVESIIGNDLVKELTLKDLKTGEKRSLEVSGIFVAVGQYPNSKYLEGLLALDPGGSIPVNNKMETVIPGIYAAGDIRSDSVRQIAGAVGDGAIAAISAEKFLSSTP
ncbi:thioredoxin-disulfide reductase [Chloroflexota bacterium]